MARDYISSSPDGLGDVPQTIRFDESEECPVKIYNFTGLVRGNHGRILLGFDCGGGCGLDGAARIRRIEIPADDLAEYIRRDYKSLLFWGGQFKQLRTGHPQKDMFRKTMDALKRNIEQFVLAKNTFDKDALARRGKLH